MNTICESGSTVIYMRFPDEGHSLAKQANRVASYRRMVNFFEEKLKPVDAEATD